MIGFLTSKKRHHPAVVARNKSPLKGEGQVRANIVEGSILLIGRRDDLKPVRLVFDGNEGETSALRSIAPGPYVVRGYRILRTDKNGVKWQLWGSGARGQKITVEQGKVVDLKMDVRVHVKTTARARGNVMQLGVGPTGDHHMGVTIIKDGHRIAASALIGDQVVKLAYG